MRMLFSLAARNVLRGFRRLAPMMFTLLLVFCLLLMGNAVLRTTVDSLYGVYAESVAGDLTISALGEDNFTVFGSDQLLVGQYLVPPTLVDFSALRSKAENIPAVRAVAGLITSAARVKIETQQRDCTVFGVDFESYPGLVPGLKLVAGSFPGPGGAGIVVQSQGWKDPVSLIGKKVLLTSALGYNFTIREVTLTGIVSYPVRDELLDSVVLVDAETARALNGYLYGGETVVSEEEQGVLRGNISDLFGASGDTAANDGGGSIDPMALFSDISDTSDISDIPAEDSDSVVEVPRPSENLEGAGRFGEGEAAEEAWNFLLLSLYKPDDGPTVARSLESLGYTEKKGYQVRDWSRSVGGTALLARFLQVLFNIGLVFVSFGAIIVTVNALLLSILERTGEIGTMRAMGAGRLRIATLIFFETFIVVMGSAGLGLLLGIWGVGSLNSAQLILDNPYIALLFGGKPIRGMISSGMVGGHIVIALVLAGLSVLYPLKRALGIHPVEAMRE
jgi:putative ABC transport system permease protein